MSKLELVNFGCRLNTYESKKMQEIAHSNGLDNNNIVIINTCAVTKEAERQARQKIRKIRRFDPSTQIIVTGCSSEIHPKDYDKKGYADYIIPNLKKLDQSVWANIANIVKKNNKTIKYFQQNTNNNTNSKKYRSFIEIQNGCNYSCTFCVIPQARGLNRSIQSNAVISSIKQELELGSREVILTGVNLTSWGQDFKNPLKFSDLIENILKSIPNLTRLRLSSLDIAEIDDKLIELFQYEKKLLPHIHFSLQSHDDMILKRMKRRHSTKQAESIINKFRKIRPDIAIGADFIVGFPTETDQMFKNTFNSIQRLGLTHTHVFPYSERPNTPASRMPKVNQNIIKERSSMLRKEGRNFQIKQLDKYIGKSEKVLIQNNDGYGLNEHFFPTLIPGSTEGKIIKCKIISSEKNYLIAKEV